MKANLLSFKSSLFTTNDYNKENKNTRPKPKRDPRVTKSTNFVDLPNCHLCEQTAIRRIIEDGTNEEFWLCREHFSIHQRKHLKFKAFFEKANQLDS